MKRNSRRNTAIGLAIVICAATLLSFGRSASADSYEYDAHGRLTKVIYSDGSYVTYTYDHAGNRTLVSATP